MSTLKSVEEIRKLELGLKDLVSKFQGRVQLIQEDLLSLIKDVEELRSHIDERRRVSNDYTRDISDLTNDLETFRSEISQIERDISSSQSNIDTINSQASQLQTEVSENKNKLLMLENEKNSIETTLRSLEVEQTALETTNNELKPKFETQTKAIMQEYNQMSTEKTLLGNKFQAIKILCTKDYIQSPEIGLIKFLAKKPSPHSKITEIRSALGMDLGTLRSVLNKLTTRGVLEFDESSEDVNLLTKIDLFDKEV